MTIFTLLGALGLFLYGMNMMSTGLQKAAGARLRILLGKMTASPGRGVLTGFGVTAAVQSSSATTVMVVGFVSAGLLTLAQAIGVIMGANIGTTMTAWIIALCGFKADVSALAVPLMALAFVLSVSKRDRMRNISELVAGFSLLFLGLSLMKGAVPDLSETPEVLEFITRWSGLGFVSVLLFLMLGTLLTLVLQSSSATVALTLILLDMGWIGFDMAAAMVLGENIGTTITANIAASVGGLNARRAAMAHTLFNVFGVVWVLCLFSPFLNLARWTVSLLGPAPEVETVYSLSMLHTLFNLANTLLLISFTGFIERLVSYLVPDLKENGAQPEQGLHYIDYAMIPTPELALEESSKECVHFASQMHESLRYVRDAVLRINDEQLFLESRDRLVEYEHMSDRTEYEIVKFLGDLGRRHLSDESKALVRSQIRICSELESLGDAGEALSRALVHMRSYGRNLSEEHLQCLKRMLDLLDDAYTQMVENLRRGYQAGDLCRAELIEMAINDCRNDCRERELGITDKSAEEYLTSVFYLNTLDQLERMGDHLVNISQTMVGA